MTDGLISKNTAAPHIAAIMQFLNEEDVERGEKSVIAITTDPILRFEAVHFKYGNNEILKDVSFEINQGDKVLVVGPNGQGKSTLLNLLMGLYRPSSGTIYIGNKLMNDIHLQSLAVMFAFIPQNHQMLPGNALDNVLLSSSHPYDSKLVDHLNMTNKMNGQPHQFSEGEKQRLTIARALYKNAPILIGDEIFSNIDADNRERIVQFIRNELAHQTVIMISHEPIDLKFNKKIVVNQGEVRVTNFVGEEVMSYK